MVSATQDLINQGISALIISAFKPDALGPIVDAAKVDLATKLMNGEKLQYSKAANREVYVPVNLITAKEAQTLLQK